MASTGTVMPAPKYTAYDNNGAPLIGGKLYVYAAGTTTPAVSYTDVTLVTPNTNPVILDAGGRATVFLAPGSYKFLQKTSADVLVWSVDGVTAVGPFNVSLDVTGLAGQALTAGQVVYLETGAAGTAGQWYLADADFPNRSSTAVMVGMCPADIADGEAGAIRLQGQVVVTGPLSTGARYYVSTVAGDVTANVPTNGRFVGQSDSPTSIVIAPNPNVDAPTTGDTTGPAGEALFLNAIIYRSVVPATDGQWFLTNSAATASSSNAAVIGFAKAAGAAGATVPIQLSGRVTGLNSLVGGTNYYVGPTPGIATTPAPANVKLVGTADSATSLLLAGSGSSGGTGITDYLTIECLVR